MLALNMEEGGTQGVQVAPQSWEGKETGPFLECPGGSSPVDTLTLAQGDRFRTSGLQNH